MPKIVIIGAGISGLSLGWFLKKKYVDNLELTILEQSAISGGYIKTIKKDDFIFELGCRSCRTAGNGLKTLQLIEDLNLESEVIIADSTAKNRYIYKNKKLECIPRGILPCLKSKLMPGLFKAVCSDLFKKKRSRSQKEETIYEFINRRFSKDFAINLFDPLSTGIYAGDIRKLSLKSCFPMIYELEHTHRSIIKGMVFQKKPIDLTLSPFIQKLLKTSIFSLKGGMQTLTHALSEHLKENILYDTNITKLEIKTNETTIHLMNGTIISPDIVYSTIPAKNLSEILSHHELTGILKQFTATSIATVSFGFKELDLKTEGFGYLIPSIEKESVLGAVFDSSVFKELNQSDKETRLTFMIGGAHMDDFDRYNEDNFLDRALKAKLEHLKINEIPNSIHVEILRNAIPQYLIGHSEKVSLVQGLCPSHLKILGSSFFGVSVNDCVAQSKIFAEKCNL